MDDHENEIQQMRQNYNRQIKGESKIALNQNIKKESIKSEERDRAQIIVCISLGVYTVLLIIFLLFLQFNADFRYYCYQVLEDMSQNGTVKGAIMIGLLGYVFVLTGFNVIFYDIIAGYLIKPFWYALLVVSVGKFLAKSKNLFSYIYQNRYTGFIIGRYMLRSFIYTAMNENIYFIVCYLAAERKPLKLMYGLQFMPIITIFKTYACGLLRITHIQYIIPTIFGTVVWAGFWVYIGYKLESIMDVIINQKSYKQIVMNNGSNESMVPWYLRLALAILAVVVIYYFFHLTKQIYEEIKAEAHAEYLSDIIEREAQEEEKTLLEEVSQKKESQIHTNDDEREIQD